MRRGVESINGLKPGTSNGRLLTDGAASMAVKGLLFFSCAFCRVWQWSLSLSVGSYVLVPMCVFVCVYALRIVSVDKILRFTNTLFLESEVGRLS